MTYAVGDKVVAESESTGRAPPRGEGRAVLGCPWDTPDRLPWQDGHETIYTPAAGALRAEAAAGAE